MKQIFVGIVGESHLGEKCHRRTEIRRAPCQIERVADVLMWIGHTNCGDTDRDPDELVRIDGVKGFHGKDGLYLPTFK